MLIASLLPRAALHSQLAAAFQVVLHLIRDSAGTRRLSEFGVFQRDPNGVRVVTATPGQPAADLLADLLKSRGVAQPC